MLMFLQHKGVLAQFLSFILYNWSICTREGSRLLKWMNISTCSFEIFEDQMQVTSALMHVKERRLVCLGIHNICGYARIAIPQILADIQVEMAT